MWKLSIEPGKFPDYLEAFQTTWKLLSLYICWHSRPFAYFPAHLKTFQAIRKLSRPSGNCPGHLGTFQIVFLGTLLNLSWNFPVYLETFQTIWKLSRSSSNIPGHLETFQAVWKLSRLSFRPPVWEFSRLFGNFPIWFHFNTPMMQWNSLL